MLVCIGLPLMLMDTVSTSRDLRSLNDDAPREARCVEISTIWHRGGRAPDLCRCFVAEARLRGIDRPMGSYDGSRVEAVFEECGSRVGIGQTLAGLRVARRSLGTREREASLGARRHKSLAGGKVHCHRNPSLPCIARLTDRGCPTAILSILTVLPAEVVPSAEGR